MNIDLHLKNIEISVGSASPSHYKIAPSTNLAQLNSYAVDKVIGQGAFATVYLATIQETGEKVAIKKALQDKKYKNRELKNLKIVGDHPNIVSLKTAFYILGQNEEVYVNFVMDYLPENLSQIIKGVKKSKKQMSAYQVKVYTFQILRGLALIHSKGMVHRDMKPQNILVDSSTHELKICDFGSAKIILKGQANTSYLCARYYRAPELVFGSTDYTSAIDIWSVGCILAEMILQEPLFPGDSSVDQLVEIMKVLGTPTPHEISEFNVQNNQEFKFPQVKAHPWSKVFLKYKPDPMLVELIKKMLVYLPQSRLLPYDALLHPYFDDLREEGLVEGMATPELWNMTQDEQQAYGMQAIKNLVPQWYQKKILK